VWDRVRFAGTHGRAELDLNLRANKQFCKAGHSEKAGSGRGGGRDVGSPALRL